MNNATETKAANIQVFYIDAKTGWAVAKFDADENQLEHALYSFLQRDAIATAKDMAGDELPIYIYTKAGPIGRVIEVPAKPETVQGVLRVVKRLDSSYDGNPRFLVEIAGQEFSTTPDSGFAYGVTNFEGREVVAHVGTHYGKRSIFSADKV